MSIQVTLLGAFQARLPDGQAVRFRSRKSAEIVAALALAPSNRLDRASLIEQIWPEDDVAAARRNLRTCLAYARHDLGLDLLSSGDESVSLNGIETDLDEVMHFHRLAALAKAPTDRIDALFSLEEALRPALLEGWSSPWIEPHRLRLRALRIEALVELAKEYESTGTPESSIAYAEVALELDPFNEAAISCLMRALAHQGKTSESAERFRHYAARLLSEMNLEPSAPVRRLASQIRTGRFEGSPLFKTEPELVTELFELALASDSERVLALLAGEGVSRRATTRAAEMLPLLEKVLRATKGWGPNRCRVAIDLIVAALHSSHYETAQFWSKSMALGARPGSYEAYVATACELFAKAGQSLDWPFDKEFAKVVALAESLGMPYQVALCESNWAMAMMRVGRFEEGGAKLTERIAVLSEDDSEKGRIATLQAREIWIEALVLQNRFLEAVEEGVDVDRQRRVYGIAHLETGASAAHGYAELRIGLFDGAQRVAEAVTRSFRQQRLAALLLSLDYAAATLALAGDQAAATQLATEVAACRKKHGILIYPALRHLLETVISPNFDADPSSGKSELSLVEEVWMRLPVISKSWAKGC